MEATATEKKRKAAQIDGEENSKVVRVKEEPNIKQEEYTADTDDEDHNNPSSTSTTSTSTTNVTIKQEEYTADTDDDDDNKKPVANTSNKMNQEEYTADDEEDTKKPAAKDEEETEEEVVAPIKQFPSDGPRRYILIRAAGDDVLQILEEHMAKGVLEIEGDSAKFWVKFPKDHGEVAARIDCVGEIEGSSPPTHFKGLACKAYIDYGMWQGPIHRDENTPGAGIFGSMVTFGTNVAEAGRDEPHFSSSDPLEIDIIYSLVLKKGESSIPDDELANLPEGFELMKEGSLCFTLFIEDGRSSYGSGRDAPAPVSFWFRPAKDQTADSSLKIPDDIVEDIGKLPPIKRD